ncbi:FAD-dependent oxidoreductase [Paenibacillus ginsengarvi]|uniref:FAD-dependent oxidoreductase n=1 Tax=Paenibacillus ginsengarvi TaxID=400777 RepID=A0A3B0B7U8_9BACL|nr:FAD-dependent oxidoreductase [Paenibacillus ginsengarvi]RKN70105.1 FAD-dependent oxidoreductase [Paenibacillus ginsengarvi]
MKQQLHADIAVIGGGLGGFAAALAAASTGKKVILTEETDWIGGQITSQGVPPDEHRWIETAGCTRTYRQFRNGVRNYYRTHFPLTEQAKAAENLNPGNALVSKISHEPRTALAVMTEMAAPYVNSGRLVILLRHIAESADTEGDLVRSVTVRCLETGERTELVAPYVLDATECGDVLPLAGVEYVTGAESREQTGEPRALEGAPNPQEMQAITYCFAMDYMEGEDHTIEKPKDYDFWRNYRPDFWPSRMLDWIGPHPVTHEARQYVLFPEKDLFPLYNYRRIADKTNFVPGTYESDITIVNWPQNDYFIGPVIDVSEEEKERHLEAAKQLSLSLLYWMQTEAPRPDGGIGYPGLRLRKDVFGTADGLAKYPYIRESRRIRAEFTVLEQHITAPFHPEGRAEQFPDSVGVGYYAIDLHPSTGNRNYIHFSPLPFQIPLGSLIPVRVNNLLPANKNIGTTHITNGCYRLHPVEWNIGESAGLLAVYCLDKQVRPRDVRANPELLAEFQQFLVRQGIELAWEAR